MTHFSAFGPDTCDTFGDSVLSATGSEPDWGPADPPAAAYVAAGSRSRSGTRLLRPRRRSPRRKASFTLGKVTAAALRKGLAVKVTLPAPGKASLVASVKGKPVASATVKASGTVRLSKVRKSLKGKTLTLKLTFSGSSATKSVKVR